MTERTQSDLVAEIIKLIRPDPGCEARCREKIGESIILIEKTDKDKEWLPEVAEGNAKAQMKELHSALERVKLLVSQLNFRARNSLFHDGPRYDYQELNEDLDRHFGVNAADFARMLALLIEGTEKWARDPRSPKDAPRRRPSKIVAADAAYRLIAEFASRPPTLTKRGRFFQVASMLLEAATGKQKADLTRYCRQTVSVYSQAAKELAKRSSGPFGNPFMKALAEELTQLASAQTAAAD